MIAVYFRLSNNPVSETLEHSTPDVFLDVDASGALVGIDMINPSSVNLRTILAQIAKRFKSKSLKDFSGTGASKVQDLVAA